MSRIANALNMYFYLSVKGKATIGQLADYLEVSERMIKKYKDDLEQAGVYISSIRGRNGYYFIEQKKTFYNIGLSESDIIALKMAKETITSGNFHYSRGFEKLAYKLLEINKSEEVVYFNKMMVESNEVINREKDIWKVVNEAIIDKHKLKIKYKSLKKAGISLSERTVHPYGVFDYKGASYVYGYCEKAKGIRFFKLSRVDSYNKTEDSFEPDNKFDFQNLMNTSFGIYNDEAKKVVLKIYYPMSEIVKEKEITKNQEIIEIDEKTILFTATMKGYEEYRTWILGMGACAEVIEPLELKADILNQIQSMMNLYK